MSVAYCPGNSILYIRCIRWILSGITTGHCPVYQLNIMRRTGSDISLSPQLTSPSLPTSSILRNKECKEIISRWAICRDHKNLFRGEFDQRQRHGGGNLCRQTKAIIMYTVKQSRKMTYCLSFKNLLIFFTLNPLACRRDLY